MNKLIFLGTGTSQGVPVIGSTHPVCLSEDTRDKRLRCSVVFQMDGKNILIDTGPDFRFQMLRENLSSIDAVLFTHEHNDHVAGLDDVRPIVFRQQKAMPLYAQKRVIDSIHRKFDYAFSENKYPGVPRLETYPIKNEKFLVEQIEVEPVEVIHGRLPIFGYRLGSVAYITDASFIEPYEKEKLKNLDVLVINALRKEPKHYSHYILEEALEVISELKPKKTYLTHISHYLGFHAEVEKELPENVFLAYDGLSIDF